MVFEKRGWLVIPLNYLIWLFAVAISALELRWRWEYIFVFIGQLFIPVEY